VPAAAIFLAGVALGQWSMLPTPIMLTAAIACLGGWAIAEAAFPQIPRAWFGHLLLSLAILFAGTAVWQINQRQGEETHIARFAPDDGEIPVTLRGRVVVAPVPNAGFHGNTYFTAEMMEVFTGERWIASSGLAQIKWRASAIAPALHRGDAIEMYGWLSRPIGPLNPGGVDLRAHLAADRIFAEVRVPRSSGLLVLRRSDEIPTPRLAGIRLFLRSKLLQHTANIDSDAANTMVALLLGQRDPSIDDVSRAFADAGVAHLLAISGAHIVFLAAVVWMLLRFVPMRPQRRELLAAGIVLLYVLATPCGPPVVRAAIVLFMVLLSRLMRRPPTYMNMLAAAAVVIVILRPADLLNAGFQLTFVCTAALLVLAERVHKGLFGRYLDRAALIADLANTRWARFKLRMMRVLCALITANLLGSITAAPLVLFHFQQMTMYGILTGLVAFPAVAVTMIAALMQLLLELVSRGAAGLFAPVSTGVAAFTVWLVEHLAALPGAAIALRAPSAGREPRGWSFCSGMRLVHVYLSDWDAEVASVERGAGKQCGDDDAGWGGDGGECGVAGFAGDCAECDWADVADGRCAAAGGDDGDGDGCGACEECSGGGGTVSAAGIVCAAG
jgi:competence protein ComEC